MMDLSGPSSAGLRQKMIKLAKYSLSAAAERPSLYFIPALLPPFPHFSSSMALSFGSPSPFLRSVSDLGIVPERLHHSIDLMF